MARTLKLPTRANALVYEPTEVFDVIHTLNNLPAGEGVVIDADQDTEPKARARARLMAGLVKAGVSIPVDDLKDVDDLPVDDAEAYAEDADEEGFVTLAGVTNVRTHAVESGAGSYTPMLSLKGNN